MRSVIQLIASRSGKTPFLLVDEILKLQDSEEELPFTISRLASYQDTSIGFPVAFTALKVGLFKKASSSSGRGICSVPCHLLGLTDTQLITKLTAKDAILRHSKFRRINVSDYVSFLATLSGGPMCACEVLLGTLDAFSFRRSLSRLLYEAGKSFSIRMSFDELAGAVVLSLWGKPVLCIHQMK